MFPEIGKGKAKRMKGNRENREEGIAKVVTTGRS
jgi:hypothetical protein